MSKDNLISDHYNRQAVTFGKTPQSCDYRCKASFFQRQRTVMQLLSAVKGKTILDVGCGPGLFTDPVSKDNFLVGLDLSVEMLRLARTSLKPVVGSGEILPFRDHSFDIVLAIEILQHVANPAFFLKELARVTKKGGELILSALHSTSLLHHLLKPFGGYRRLHFHLLEDICGLLEKAGFMRIETHFLGFPFPVTWQADLGNPFSPLATSWIIRFRKEARG